MTLQDFIATSLGNLWRMKLRAFLTTTGVVIAIAAFVSMVSFGAGMQKNINEQFDELGLFSTMQVYPPRKDEVADTGKTAVLDQAAVRVFSELPGVNLVYPFDAFSVSVVIADTQLNTKAQALPQAAIQTRLYSQLLAGNVFADDSTREVLITDGLLEKLAIKEPDSVIGLPLVVTAELASIDSGIARVFDTESVNLQKRLTEIQFDSLLYRQRIRPLARAAFDTLLSKGYLHRLARIPFDSLTNRDYLQRFVGAYLRSLANEDYLKRLAGDSFDSLVNQDYFRHLISQELKGAISRFLGGYMNARVVVCDTLTVCGVLKNRDRGRTRTEPVILPIGTAALFSSGGLSDDPTNMFTALQSGSLFAPQGEVDSRNYPRVTLNVDPTTNHQTISDTIKAMGYRTFSFAEQFDEIQKFFWYFDLALGLIGLIALVTASLGIINTMVMSILERTREIGVLKSLGADERDIRWLFLVESGAIGAIGAMVGIFVGWLITRAVSFIARWYMAREGIDEMELFALPWWLIVIALSFGVLVSLAAGFYPASRAARIDPVAALRND